MNFKTILLITATIVIPVTSYALEGDYTLIKEVDRGTLMTKVKLYQGNISGKCYYEFAYGYRHALLSEVDCRDHGVNVKNSAPTPLIDFIKNNCTTPIQLGMNGKLYATCNLPEDYLDKIKYEELKSKFEKGEAR